MTQEHTLVRFEGVELMKFGPQGHPRYQGILPRQSNNGEREHREHREPCTQNDYGKRPLYIHVWSEIEFLSMRREEREESEEEQSAPHEQSSCC